MRSTLFIPAIALLSACTTTAGSGGEGAAGRVPDSCQAEPGQRFIGQRATAGIGSAIVAATNSHELRWVPPDTIITMEYKFARVTVSYDRALVITQVVCG